MKKVRFEAIIIITEKRILISILFALINIWKKYKFATKIRPDALSDK